MKTTLSFPGGPEVKADVLRRSCLAIHRSFDGKGFVLTHIPTLRCVTRRRLKKEVVELRRALDALDWTDPAAIREEVERIIN